jgi:tetratricopeptide (TPR) repeat protein
MALEQQGALFEAVQAWEVLALLRPMDYGDRLAAVQLRLEAKAQEHMVRARQEHKRGDLAAAEQYYLSAMALQPQNKEAADALRGIERARIRQEHLLKPGRTQPPNDTAGKRPAPPVASNPLLMEQASNLARQGDFNEAIELMAGQLKAVPGDQAARDLLAELLYKKAQSLQTKDKEAAQAALKRCLQVAPKHAGCRTQLGVAPAAPASAPTRTGAFSPAKP